MHLAALLSGGKDSIHAAALCEYHGWSVEELLTLFPEDEDALLFHTPNLRWIPLLAKAWGKKHRFHPVEGKGEEAELLALRESLSTLPAKGIEGVVVGAIDSTYQWARIWHVASKLGLKVFAPLWRATPEFLLAEEILSGMEIRISQVASEPLGEELLGQRFDLTIVDRMKRLGNEVRPFHLSGEGGDYETLVLNAPFFTSPVEVLDSHVERRGAKATWVIDHARLTTVREG